MVYLIGFHARSMPELEKVISIPGVNLVELKPDGLQRKGSPLYFYESGRFRINDEVAQDISQKCQQKGVTMQLHLPYESSDNPEKETGLCQANRQHHEILLRRYVLVSELLERYKIGTVVTVHPPAIRFDHEEPWPVEEALKAGTEFYAKLDALIKERGYEFKVGIENLVLPKPIGGCLGYTPKQIDTLIGNTSTIGITVDSGHRLLNSEMSIAKLMSIGEVVNLHFHSNSGVKNDENWDDDEHLLATQGNLKHYKRYVTTVRRKHIPVILEIGKLMHIPEEKLAAYIKKLRERIETGEYR